MADAYGRNSEQVTLVLEWLRDLPPKGWKALEDAHAKSKTIDAAQDALATVLTTAGLRPSWFELRATVKTLAEKAAADYAALTHEAPRTSPQPSTSRAASAPLDTPALNDAS